ncbi:MAG TPA: hypothetical protein VGB97_01775 [Candidatus Paceibacterota bacterium]|jgi:hypothetical protein
MGTNAKEFLSGGISQGQSKEAGVASYLKLLVNDSATLNQQQLVHVMNEIARIARLWGRDRRQEAMTIIAVYINSCREE